MRGDGHNASIGQRGVERRTQAVGPGHEGADRATDLLLVGKRRGEKHPAGSASAPDVLDDVLADDACGTEGRCRRLFVDPRSTFDAERAADEAERVAGLVRPEGRPLQVRRLPGGLAGRQLRVVGAGRLQDEARLPGRLGCGTRPAELGDGRLEHMLAPREVQRVGLIVPAVDETAVGPARHEGAVELEDEALVGAHVKHERRTVGHKRLAESGERGLLVRRNGRGPDPVRLVDLLNRNQVGAPHRLTSGAKRPLNREGLGPISNPDERPCERPADSNRTIKTLHVPIIAKHRPKVNF